MANGKHFLAAIEKLDDPKAGKQKLTFYRNGTSDRGHLHARRRCWKHKWTGTSITLTYREAAQQNICPECFTAEFQPQDDLQAALTLNRIEQRLNRARVDMTTGGPREASAALSVVDEARDEIEYRANIDGVHTYRTSVIALADEIAADATSRLRDGAVTATHAAALEILETANGRGETISQYAHVPYIDQPLSERVGGIERSNGLQAKPNGPYYLYRHWITARKTGNADQARADTVTETATRTQLTGLRQLTGLTLATGTDPVDAQTAIETAWQDRITSDIEKLIAAWEHAYQRNLTRTEPIAVGINLGPVWEASDDAITMIRTFDHVETHGRYIGNYPRIVAEFLTGQLGTDVVSTANKPIDDTARHTVAVLWDPDSYGAYSTFADAVTAAEKL